MSATLAGFIALRILAAFANASDYVDVKANATVKCEIHEKCDHPVEGMEIRTYFLPKGQFNGAESGIMWFMDNHKSTRKVRFGGDYRRDKEYYLRILHSCPCSNTTATDPCDPSKQAFLCIDIDDKLKSVPQGEKRLAFDLGTLDLSAPWKYAHCSEYDEGVNTPCSP